LGRELLVVWAGRHQRSAWEELIEVYRRRIERFLPVRDCPVRARTGAADPQRGRTEAAALLAALPSPCYLVALDGGGEMLSSEAFASRLERLQREWAHPVAFVVGSDLGLDPAVRSASQLTLSLGPMTLSHEIARLVLYEQLYRALSITAGMSYHRAPP
jgi:23S rRNA (pseudouridine1915-N3)-methyltransferase